MSKSNPEIINTSIDILLHGTFLFIFLVVLFKYIIAPKTSELLNGKVSELTHGIKNVKKHLVTELQKFVKDKTNVEVENYIRDNKFEGELVILNHLTDGQKGMLIDIISRNVGKVTEDTVNKIIDQALLVTSTSSKYVLVNNQMVFNTSYLAIGFLVILIIGIIGTMYIMGQGNKLSLKHTIVTLILVMGIVGIFEYLFFVNIIFKYVPITQKEILTNINNSL